MYTRLASAGEHCALAGIDGMVGMFLSIVPPLLGESQGSWAKLGLALAHFAFALLVIGDKKERGNLYGCLTALGALGLYDLAHVPMWPFPWQLFPVALFTIFLALAGLVGMGLVLIVDLV